MSMMTAPNDPNPVDDLQTSVTTRLRDALYASEAMLRHRAMRPDRPDARTTPPEELPDLSAPIPDRPRPAPNPIDRDFPDLAGATTAPAADGSDPQAAHLEGLALQTRGAADDVTTPTVDEAALGDQDFDQYRTMAAAHRATFPAPDPASPARVPAGKAARPAPASARRLATRR